MRIRVGADQLLLDLTGPCIRHEEVDPKQVLLGEESDEAPVRTHRGRHVLPPRASGRRKEQGSRFTRSLPACHEGQIFALNGLSPSDRETV